MPRSSAQAHVIYGSQNRQHGHSWPEGDRAFHRTFQQTISDLKSMQEPYEYPVAATAPADSSVEPEEEMEEQVEAALCSLSLEAQPAPKVPFFAAAGADQPCLAPLDWSTLLLNVQDSQGLHDVDNLNKMLYGLRKETQKFSRRSKTQACSSRGLDSAHALARKSKVLQKRGRIATPGLPRGRLSKGGQERKESWLELAGVGQDEGGHFVFRDTVL